MDANAIYPISYTSVCQITNLLHFLDISLKINHTIKRFMMHKLLILDLDI